MKCGGGIMVVQVESLRAFVTLHRTSVRLTLATHLRDSLIAATVRAISSAICVGLPLL